MNRSILGFLQEYHMVSPGDRVIVAVSGGKDSMALLHVLLELQETLQISLEAAHFDHQLRGRESERDRAFVAAHCRALSVPLHLGSADVGRYARENNLSLEDAARTLRYQFLEGISPSAKIATAHNAQDNLETLLLNLIRGCNLRGLGGIAPVRGRIIRPLLMTEPREILDYLTRRRIPHVEDSSNRSDAYLRNRLRRNVIPLLMNENPAILSSASALCLSLRQEEALLEGETARVLHGMLSENRGLSCAALRELPKALALRVLERYLWQVPRRTRTHIENAYRLAFHDCPSARLTLPGGFVLSRQYDFLLLAEKTEEPVPGPVSLMPGETASFGRYQISCIEGPAPETPGQGRAVLSSAGVRLPLTIRGRRPGDTITLPGGTKKLSRVMIDKKIPAALRDFLPVVVQDDEVLALLPNLIAAGHRPQQGSPSLYLTVKMEEPL